MSTFGMVSFFLECIPLLGVVFNITNAVGIALYDCHLEKKYGGMDEKASDVGVADSEETLNVQPKPTQEINSKKVKNYGTNHDE